MGSRFLSRTLAGLAALVAVAPAFGDVVYTLTYENYAISGAFNYDGVVTLTFAVSEQQHVPIYIPAQPADGSGVPAFGVWYIDTAQIDVTYFPTIGQYTGVGDPVPYHGTVSGFALDFYDRPASGPYSSANFVLLDNRYGHGQTILEFQDALFTPAAGGGPYGGTVFDRGTYYTGGEHDSAYGVFTAVNTAVAVDPPGANVVPEPATWALMAGGLGMIGATVRRRRGQS